jgi:hypothetical protein
MAPDPPPRRPPDRLAEDLRAWTEQAGPVPTGEILARAGRMAPIPPEHRPHARALVGMAAAMIGVAAVIALALVLSGQTTPTTIAPASPGSGAPSTECDPAAISRAFAAVLPQTWQGAEPIDARFEVVGCRIRVTVSRLLTADEIARLTRDGNGLVDVVEPRTGRDS